MAVLHNGQKVTCQGQAAQGVIDDLVPDQDLDRVRPRILADLDEDNRLTLVQPIAGFARRDAAAADRWQRMPSLGGAASGAGCRCRGRAMPAAVRL